VSRTFLLAVGVLPLGLAIAFWAGGDVGTDGGWGTVSGVWEALAYAGFPLAAAVAAYAAWWIAVVAVYAFVSTAFLGEGAATPARW
jgi:hypothetical protein